MPQLMALRCTPRYFALNGDRTGMRCIHGNTDFKNSLFMWSVHHQEYAAAVSFQTIWLVLGKM